MSTKRAAAARIGRLGLDAAFADAEARSLAGHASEIWCRRDSSGGPVAYRVVPSRPGKAVPDQWEQIAFFPAAGRPRVSKAHGAFPKSA